MNKFHSFLNYLGAGLAAAAVAAEAAVEKGLIKADNPILSKTLGWGSVAAVLLQAFAAAKAAPAAPMAPAPSMPAPVAPAA